MKRRADRRKGNMVARVFLLFCVSASTACVDFIVGGCGGRNPTIVVLTSNRAGEPVDPDRVEIFADDGSPIQPLTCSSGECPSGELRPGTYKVVATRGTQVAERDVRLAGSQACRRGPTRVEITL